MKKKNLLLHVCCRDCVEHVLDAFINEYNTTIFWYNPNIHPESEWLRRFRDVKAFCREKKLKLISSDYGIMDWKLSQEVYSRISFNENDVNLLFQKRFLRCEKCYYLRLEKLVDLAIKKGYFAISTTMLNSTYQSIGMIDNLLTKLCSVNHLCVVKLKEDKDSIKKGFYKQNYCGCIYSLIEKFCEK